METQQYLETDFPADPLAEPLTGIVGRAAVQGQIIEYPRQLVGHKDPEIPGQRVALVSFDVFDAPVHFTLGGKAVGMVKVRGIYSSTNEAVRNAGALARTTDSVYRIGLCPVGEWIPIVEDINAASKRVIAVGEQTDLNKLILAEEKKMASFEEAKSERDKLALDTRMEKAATKDHHDDVNSIEFYTMTVRTTLYIYNEVLQAEETLKKKKRQMKKQKEILAALDEAHPTYAREWEAVHRDAVKETGGEAPTLLPREREFLLAPVERKRAPKNYTRVPIRKVKDVEAYAKRPDDEANYDDVYEEDPHDYDSSDGETEQELNEKRTARVHLFERLKLPIPDILYEQTGLNSPADYARMREEMAAKILADKLLAEQAAAAVETVVEVATGGSPSLHQSQSIERSDDEVFIPVSVNDFD